MTVTETVKGRYHTIISDASTISAAMTELTNFLNESKVNPIKVIKIDPTNKLIIFYN